MGVIMAYKLGYWVARNKKSGSLFICRITQTKILFYKEPFHVVESMGISGQIMINKFLELNNLVDFISLKDDRYN